MKKKKDILSLKLKLCALALSSTLSLTGCLGREVAMNSSIEHTTLDQNNVDDVKNGTTQIIKVPNNDFNLVVNYKFNLCQNERWTITDDKDIVMEINTENLSEGTQVYIDNIHTDTKIVSYSPYSNGVLQDTMDDRIHNSLMLGFPISNDESYVGVNHIEGQNDTFISGYSYGGNGYSSGSISQRRRLESEYLESGVYANEISSVIDLIIVDENNVTSCVSVNSDISVPVWPFTKYVDDGTVYYNYYYYDDNSTKIKKLSEEKYNEFINNKDSNYQKTLK